LAEPQPKGRRWDLAFRLIQTQITAREIAKEMVKPITVQVLPEVKIKARTTHTWPHSKNFTVRGMKAIVDEGKPGLLRELTAISASNGFGITVNIDGERLWEDDWSTLNWITTEVEAISAREVTVEGETYYWLAMRNIGWAYRAKILLRAITGSVTFRDLRATWEVQE